jgi:hypothetical protein
VLTFGALDGFDDTHVSDLTSTVYEG